MSGLSRALRALVRLLRWPCLWLIRGYQLIISPHLRGSCRFSPTCSAYAYQAIERFGVLRGTYLAIRRMLKCHPFHGGGEDPVPQSFPLRKAHSCATGEENTE